MDSLIERIEAATGPDRELDLDIARLQGVVVLKRNHEDTANYETTHWRYTASIDAAMTLVPEGFCWTVAVYWCEGEDKPPYFADCADLPAMQAGDFQVPIHEAWAATPALALVAAALKARTTHSTGEA
ncbi:MULTISPECIES: hypothetical protein [unclassified Sphingopyxis]|uniref:hypothetical protein n=1 Tax=unclassified Sphingopyxis TaxID=2614943 RepID=UPI000AF92BC2|nr:MULTISPECIES: hypothetical protein [unclassified Sphingopyxis]